jgi:hypothetical protein
MSPLALPRSLLHNVLDDICKDLPAGAFIDVLQQLKNRPTFEEQWPDSWQAGLVKGKARMLKLEHIRGDTLTMGDILKENSEIHAWYENIRTD